MNSGAPEFASVAVELIARSVTMGMVPHNNWIMDLGGQTGFVGSALQCWLRPMGLKGIVLFYYDHFEEPLDYNALRKRLGKLPNQGMNYRGLEHCDSLVDPLREFANKERPIAKKPNGEEVTIPHFAFVLSCGGLDSCTPEEFADILALAPQCAPQVLFGVKSELAEQAVVVPGWCELVPAATNEWLYPPSGVRYVYAGAMDWSGGVTDTDKPVAYGQSWLKPREK